jgi:hypothetical protein
MPSGYTFKALVGAVRNDGSSNFIPFKQEGNRVFYNAVQTIKDGGFATSAWTAQDVTGIFPSTAKFIHLAMGGNDGDLAISPRSDGSAGQYCRLQVPGAGNTTWGGVMPTARETWASFDIRYEDSIYYYVNLTNASLIAAGWEF